MFCAFVLTLCACGSGGGGGGSAGLATVAGGGGGNVIPGLPPSSAPAGGATPTPAASASPKPGATPTPGPAPGNTPTPGPSGNPSPVPTGYFAQGIVHDFASNTPIAGATVVIAPPLYAGSTPPSGVSTSTTTAADGSFTIAALIPGSNFIEVFQPGFATLHKKLNITSFNNQLGTIPLTLLSGTQNSWLAQVNSDRSAWGAAPVVFDEILVEGALHWTNYMGTNGWYHSYCPASDATCQTAVQFETALGGGFTATGSNVDAEVPPGSWQTAESRMMAEASNCPPPVSPATCPAASAPEFLNIVNSNFIWTGLSEYDNGKGYTLAYPFINYFDQEFATPIHQ